MFLVLFRMNDDEWVEHSRGWPGGELCALAFEAGVTWLTCGLLWAMGWKGDGECEDTLSSLNTAPASMLNEFVTSILYEWYKELFELVVLQRKQYQCSGVEFSWEYWEDFILMHEQWNQMPQLSQATPLSSHETFKSHIPHGYMLFTLGPGLLSMSPHIISIILVMNNVCLSAFIWKDLVLSGLPKARMSLHNVAAGILRLRSCDIVTNGLKAENIGKSGFSTAWNTALLTIQTTNKHICWHPGYAHRHTLIQYGDDQLASAFRQCGWLTA